MSPLFPFNVKHSSLLSGPTGYTNTHPLIKSLVDMVCEVSRNRGWEKPTVTQFGRYVEEEDGLYFKTFYDQFIKRLTPKDAREAAHKAASSKASWHCVPVIDAFGGLGDRKIRAVDFRTVEPGTDRVVYDEVQCAEFIHAVKGRFIGHVEALHHQVKGSAPHLHFGLPDPLGKPTKWLSREDLP